MQLLKSRHLSIIMPETNTIQHPSMKDILFLFLFLTTGINHIRCFGKKVFWFTSGVVEKILHLEDTFGYPASCHWFLLPEIPEGLIKRVTMEGREYLFLLKHMTMTCCCLTTVQ